MTQEEFKKILKNCMATNDITIVARGAMEVAESDNPYFICDFAEFVPLSDDPSIMPILEDGMIATGDVYHCYEFAFCMADHDKKFNLPRFEDLMIQGKRGKILYYFLECVKGANIEKVTNGFLQTTDDRWLQEYLNNDEILKIHSEEDLPYLCQEDTLFKKYLVAYKLEGHENEIGFPAALSIEAENSKDPEFITTAGEYYHNDRLFNAIMATDDLLHIYEYYCAVPNLSEQEKSIILDYLKNNNYINSAKYMYYVSEYTDLPADQVEEMLKAAKKTGNQEYIEKIAATLERKREEETQNE